jgi:hypothetical protein
MQIEEVITAVRSPWQNAYVERLIGTVRRECLDHVIVLSEGGLRKVLKEYFRYYDECRPHESLGKNSPTPRAIELGKKGPVLSIPEVGGLHHRYQRALEADTTGSLVPRALLTTRHERFLLNDQHAERGEACLLKMKQ